MVEAAAKHILIIDLYNFLMVSQKTKPKATSGSMKLSLSSVIHHSTLNFSFKLKGRT